MVRIIAIVYALCITQCAYCITHYNKFKPLTFPKQINIRITTEKKIRFQFNNILKESLSHKQEPLTVTLIVNLHKPYKVRTSLKRIETRIIT